MSSTDWLVLVATLAAIILYGLYKSSSTRNLDGYFLSNRSMPWYLVMLSIMGTQASAITFLSAPGQAYTDGMRFVQYYFGLPLAMVVIAASFVPVFHKLRVFTAYEYLEQRFDLKTRVFTSFLFLLQRGLSTGISIYAPAIILSSLMGWNIYWTNIIMGGVLIIYTMTGGARAVAYTQQLQFLIIFAGMFFAGYMVVKLLPEGVGFMDALHVSGKLGKLNVITSGEKNGGFDWTDRYNIWSGLIGGFFLALSYFGTDQSQVGRYLTARSLEESRTGLLMNGLVKVPMQFLILLVGALVFTFYQFHTPPVFFNKIQVEKVESSARYRDSFPALEKEHIRIAEEKQAAVRSFTDALHRSDTIQMNESSGQLMALNHRSDSVRRAFTGMLANTPGADANDTNYIFLRFVIDYLPPGLVGLLIAVIFMAAWGSIAAALNSLSSSTMVDFHKRLSWKSGSEESPVQGTAMQEQEKKEYRWSRRYTLFWGIFCIVVAQFSNRMGSLIEAVNVLGSLFYGVILGIFLVAFYLKKIGGNAVFIAALIVEAGIILMFAYTKLGFLWLNLVGALAVVVLAWVLQVAGVSGNNRVSKELRGR